MKLPAAGLYLSMLILSIGFGSSAAAQDDVARARELIDQRKAAEALEILKPLTTPESTNPAAFLALGAALRQLRRFGEGLDAYRRAEELSPGSAEAIVGQADLHARLRQYPAAEEKFRRLLEANPRAIEARVGLAWVLSLQRKLDDALAEIRKALEIDPRHYDSRIRLGWIRLWRHERVEAQRAFEGILAEKPGHVEAALGLAAVDVAEGRLYSASSVLETLVRLHPENVDVLMAVARIRARRGRTYSALDAVKRVRELQGDHVEAFQLLGELAIRDGRFAEGERHYRQALALEPEDVGSRTGVATALRRQGRREEAKAVYREVLDRDPDHPNARIGLGWEYTWEGRYDEASAEFERVIARDPRNTDALAGLARVRHLQGRWSESQELYDRALSADPWDDAALEGAAQMRRLRESRARLSYVHAEEFERDQVAEVDALRLVADALTLTWRKRITAATALDVEARMTMTREINRAAHDDNYDVRHSLLAVGARHELTDHWTLGGRIGAGRFDDNGSGGTWTFDSAETFVEGAAWATANWDGHALAVSWARSPLLIKAFPSFDLDVLRLNGYALAYESPWWRDGLTPEWHDNRIEATLSYTAYSDDNAKAAIDATFRHRLVFDNGWRIAPLVRFRFADFQDDVAFYYSFDRQTRLTAGVQVDYEPPGAWSFRARYQATQATTKERVNPGARLFDPTLPIDATAKTVVTDGHAIDARAAWLAGDAIRLGAEAGYTWDNDHYVTWSAGLFIEAGF